VIAGGWGIAVIMSDTSLGDFNRRCLDDESDGETLLCFRPRHESWSCCELRQDSSLL
jgi:hypothetical protein